jgi:hypothetical protein
MAYAHHLPDWEQKEGWLGAQIDTTAQQEGVEVEPNSNQKSFLVPSPFAGRWPRPPEGTEKVSEIRT